MPIPMSIVKSRLSSISFLSALLLVFSASTIAAAAESANDTIEGGSAYLEEVETQASEGGLDDEVDAGVAEVEAAEAGEDDLLSPAQTQRIEEIVVSARKRAEFLEDTPIAVTALGANTLRESGITRLDGIQEQVPNMSIIANPSGSTTFQIRGIGTSNRSMAFDPGVGVYVDGVFMPRSMGLLMDIVDVEQIEVLRGPQGTLFGKNTVGGAVNLTTTKPGDELEGSVFIQPGNLGTVVTRFTLNVPVDLGWLEDKLFARFSGSTTNTRGYVYDDNPLREEYFSNRDSVGFYGSLRFLPTEDITIDLAGSWSRDHNKGLGGQCVFVASQPTAPTLLPPGFYEDCQESEPFRNNANVAQLNDITSYGTWMTADWNLGEVGFLEDLSLKSLTSWRVQTPRYRFDLDSTRFAIAQFASAGGPDGLSGQPGYQRQISQELQVSGQALDGALQFVTGAFGFFEKGDEVMTTRALPPQGQAVALDRTTEAETTIDNYTWALFGQATYDIFDWMSLTGGLRYTEDKKGLTFLQVDPLKPEDPPFADQEGDRVFPSWTPMGSLALTVPEEWLDETPLEHVMGYFTYSRGFKGGGFNAVAGSQSGTGSGEAFSFEPETLDNFELGFKLLGLDGIASMNLALFYGLYDNIQVTTIRDLGLDENGVPQIERLTLNAAEATNKGVELEFLIRPLPGMQVNATLGYLDAKYDSFDGFSDLDGTLIDRSGEPFIGVPELRTFIGIQYSLPVPLDHEAMAGFLTPRIEWAYQSAINYLGPEVPQARQGGVNLINARLSYSFLDNSMQIALWGKNLSDETYFNSATPLVTSFGTLSRYYALPRTFGGEIAYRF